jgi:DNA polymerase III alpha subunit
MSENFVHTHIHTVYSVYDAVNTPEQMVEQAVKHGHKAMAITDHGVMGGTYNFQQACLKNGIKPPTVATNNIFISSSIFREKNRIALFSTKIN